MSARTPLRKGEPIRVSSPRSPQPEPAAQSERAAPKAPRRGVALIMVMVMTTILAALAADLENEAQVNLRAAANARDSLQAHFHARSALELELFVLRFQNMISSNPLVSNMLPVPLFEMSGFLVSSDTVKGIVNRDVTPKDAAVTAEEGDSDRPFGDFIGSFWIDGVSNEQTKINLNGDYGVGAQNAMPRLMAAVFSNPKYDVVFENMGDSRDPQRNRIELIANIIDWADGNETVDPVTAITGDAIAGTSEDTRYNSLPYKAYYKPKDGMYNSLAELRMVPLVNDAFMRLFSEQFTVWGDRKTISLKNPSTQQLRDLVFPTFVNPLTTPGYAGYFEQFMEAYTTLTALSGGMVKFSKDVLRSLFDQAEIPYDRANFEELAGRFDFENEPNIYRITAVGRVNDASTRLTVVWRPVGNGPGEFKYWREE
ncbi:MAG: hypothetical protein AAFN74_16340 [Myxococcota bacterium]